MNRLLEWNESFAAVKPTHQTVVVIGAIDTGKTSWLLHFARILNDTHICFVNGDLGQGIIGAPGLLASAHLNQLPPHETVSVQRCVFIGHNQPVGHFMSVLTGLHHLVEDARTKAQWVLVDTDGLVSGTPGFEYKRNLIHLLQPATVVIFVTPETEALVEYCAYLDKVQLYRVTPPAEIQPKSPANRWETRHRRYESWFTNARLYEFSLDTIRLIGDGFGWGQPLSPDETRAMGDALEVPILYGEVLKDTITLLVARPPLTLIYARIRERWGFRHIHIVPAVRWLRRLMGDIHPDGFSRGMGYFQGWDTDTRRIRILGRFLEDPGRIWRVGSITYPERVSD